MSELSFLLPGDCRFFKTDGGILRVEIRDKQCCRQVVLRRLFPVKRPDHFISVGDGKDEVGIIEDLAIFDAETRRMVKEELDFYYAVPDIQEIELLKDEYGYYHWKTRTDRGARDFYVKGRTENVHFTNQGEVLITDVYNCRYRIPDIGRLPRQSRNLINQVY